MLNCNLNFLEQYYFVVLVLSMLSSGPGKSLTGSSICQPTPCSRCFDHNTWHSPLCPLPQTWPPMCSALLFARGSQRLLRFKVSCSTVSQANRRWKLTRTEVLSEVGAVEKVRQTGKIEETFQTFSVTFRVPYLASPRALNMFSEPP